MRRPLQASALAFALATCLTAPSWAEDGGGGIVHGDDHAFVVQAPDGWVLDNKSGVGQGLHAVFYPVGSSWEGSDVVMYVNTARREGPHQNLAELIEFNERRIRSQSPHVTVEELPDVATSTGRTFAVRRYTGDRWGNFESVAYLEEETVLVLIALTARSQELYDASQAAYAALLREYQFVTTEVVIEKPEVPAPTIGGFELGFWAGPSVAEDPRVRSINEDHPCGPVAVARVARMPDSTGDSALEPDRVIEFDPSGEEITRWAIPTDRGVHAISGPDLIFLDSPSTAEGAPALAISSDGGIRRTAVPANAPEAVRIECPSTFDFGESAYLRCFELGDGVSGEVRRIAYEGPCT